VARRTTSSAAAPRGDRGRLSGGVAGILAALCLLDVAVARAAAGTPAPAWEAVTGLAVGVLVAGAVVLLALQVRRLQRALPAAAPPGGSPLEHAQYELAKRMRGDLDPETLAAAVLDYAGDYYDASVGVLYLARPDDSLEPAATFGLAPEASPPRAVPLGEGIVGRAAARQRVAVLDDVDETHLDLATGLGRSSPRSVIVAPFLAEDEVKGALELAVAGPVADQDLDFLRSSARSVAMALGSALARARVQRLLKETRRQAEVLAGQRRQLQQKNTELERADRYKNEFLANMSHELRTPLNSMLIMSQVLAENRPGNLSTEQVENALTINKAGSELLLIINDVLDMSRVEAGRLEVHPEPTDLRQVVRGLEDLFRPVAERQGLDLRTTFDSAAPRTAVTDPLRVSQILKNLLDNAFKFTSEGGIELRLCRVDAAGVDGLPGRIADWVAVTVSDTGIGMDVETVGQVFGVFRQGDGSVARRYGGSGLGLSISRSLAKLLGGDIRVTSREGRGSTFTLLLPRGTETTDATAATDATDATGRRPAAALDRQAQIGVPSFAAADEAIRDDGTGPLAGRRVLLADTDMRSVYELSGLLDGMGAEVGVARSAAAVRERLGTGAPWDLLVVDGRLLVGPDAFDPAAEATGARVIVLDGTDTATAADPDRRCLAKPVVAADFHRLCRDLCRGRGGAENVEHREAGMTP